MRGGNLQLRQGSIRSPFAHGTRTVFDRFFQLVSVALQPIVAFKRNTQKLEQLLSCSFVWLSQTIENAKAVSTILNQPSILQICQMTRHIRLRSIEHVLNVAAAKFAVKQQIDDTQTILISETLERPLQIAHIVYIRIPA